MKLTASDIANLAAGSLRGDAALRVWGAAPLETAGPEQLSFVARAAMAKTAAASKAGCLLAPDGAQDLLKDFPGTVIFTKNPKYAFTLVLRQLEKELRPLPLPGVHPSASVSMAAILGKDVHVGAYAVIEDGAAIAYGAVIGAQCYVGRNARVGVRSRLYPGVKVMDACEIGSEVIIHAGAVIGADGYGYISPEGRHEKIPQLGKVLIEDRVEIGANTTIDRAALESTVIGSGTKIDNLVQIAHNVRIGSNCLIMALAGIAGSTVIGDNVIVGGHAAISDHLTVGKNTVIMGKTGVMSSLGPGQLVFGHLARPRLEALKIEVLLGKLPDMHKAITKIKRHLGLDAQKNDKKPGNA
ncbi:MAG: UDP-3-O-(3-hydroxymyristoyl)glucosamine N-acyltransferase [Elusimicrobia bacterium RIFOXYA2_FULL_58_8]|nr:MAG: UDP-3-O-(3-hydroxymyristoyl)glucosamine N-acyltransferase [Elusimicrobia bacterium RIFOXYA2_FULL_58_8]